ncbi:MAG: two-partner secretion domain-containing protein, partial [Planctomycetota bacterium]
MAHFLAYLLLVNVCLPAAWSGPEGAQVVNGEVSIQQSAYNTTITASDKAVINYSSFDIAQPETVQFIQPSTRASVLNRILSANPTNINGTLLANGRVFFVNPAGVYIGEGARINVNQLVASALNISDSDFINGRHNFVGGGGAVVNKGDISAEQVYLIGRQVANSGNINCPAGYVVMAAGDRVFLGEPGSEIVLEIDASSLPESADAGSSGTGVLNEGAVEAAGGIIALAAAGDIYSQAILNVGSISTSTETGRAGDIRLAAAGGEVTNTGTIEASGSEGGQIAMEGAKVGQFGVVHADGAAGNGGHVSMMASEVVALSSQSLTTANAGVNGDGGDVIVYSPDTALFRNGARIEAKGGSESGDGGFVEVSGKKHVEVFGTADASAAKGTGGLFFIDPYNITVQAAAGTLDGLTPDFVAGAADSTVGEAAIETQLDSGTSVLIRTADGAEPTQTGLITQNVQIDKSAGGNATITYDAAGDIVLNSGISSTAGQLNVVMQANSATGGTPTGTGSVDIGAAITTNGGSFTSSGVDFDNTGGVITTTGGDVTLTHTGTITVGANIDSSGADGGAFDISGASMNLNEQLVASNADISVAVSGGSIQVDNDASAEIITTNGTVSLTANTISGPGSHALDLDGATVLDISDTGAGDIIINELTTSTITSTTITVANAASGDIDVSYDNGDSIDINNDHALNNVDLDQGVSSFSYTATTGDVTIDTINTGAESTTVTADTGAITDGTGGESSNIIASNTVLTASAGIGEAIANGDIDTTVGTLTAHVTSVGGIYIEDADAITLADVDTITISAGGLLTATDVQAAGLASDVMLTTSAGGMDLQLVTASGAIVAVAGAGDIEVDTLSAGNAIELTANTGPNQKITDLDGNSNLQTSAATLTTSAGIGDLTHYVGTNVDTLTAHVTG